MTYRPTVMQQYMLLERKYHDVLWMYY